MPKPITEEDVLTTKGILRARNEQMKEREKEFEGLVKQVQQEYKVGWHHAKPRWDENALRLKLYNNQKRDKSAIGDPLLFTTFQTLFANLYNDRLAVAYEPRMEGDEDMAENWNSIAEFDYEEMEKDILDYDWIWDSMFFGTSECMMMDFDRTRTVPVPEILDPMVTVRSPFAKSAQGDARGRGGLTFLYWESTITRRELKASPVYFNLVGTQQGGGGDTFSQIERNVELRADAQGHDAAFKLVKGLTGDNQQIIITKGITWWKGKMVYIELANDRKKIIRYSELKFNRFPVIDRKLFPTAHNYEGVSIPDLVEDKQRARSVLENLTLQNAKYGLYPTYLYDTNKIKNKNDLNREMNKHVGIDGAVGNNVIVPVQRAGVGTEVGYIMNVLEASAQSSTSTPNQQQGVLDKDKRTATENALISQAGDKRFSLSARVFGWSEKRFWKQHYDLYTINFKEKIDDKVVRIKGAFGTKFEKLSRKDLIGNTHPDIIIESKAISDAKRTNELASHSAYIQQIAVVPDANLRYALKKSGRLRGYKKDEIDRMLPPTIDEMVAEDENEILNSNKTVPVKTSEDHQIHLEMHAKAKDTPALRKHIEAHRKALMVRRENPEIDSQLPPSAINPAAQREEQLEVSDDADVINI
jgi:hypothetical protein